MSICQCIKVNGQICTRKASTKVGTKHNFCWQHQNCQSLPKPILPTSGETKHETKHKHTLSISNLDERVKIKDLNDLFSKSGPIIDFKINYGQSNDMDKINTAIITFDDYRDAKDAMTDFNGYKLYAYPINIDLIYP